MNFSVKKIPLREIRSSQRYFYDYLTENIDSAKQTIDLSRPVLYYIITTLLNG